MEYPKASAVFWTVIVVAGVLVARKLLIDAMPSVGKWI